MAKFHHLISSLFVAATSLAVAAGAQAQSSTSGSNYSLYGSGNSYMGFSAGLTDYKLGDGTGLFGSDKNTTAYNVSVGSFFINGNLGAELGYTDFGKVTRAGGSTKADGINLSLIGRVPLGNSFNLLGKVGTTYARTDVSSDPTSGVTPGSKTDFGWSAGIGAEFAFSRQWSAVLQYEQHHLKYAGDVSDRVNVTSLGARYRF